MSVRNWLSAAAVAAGLSVVPTLHAAETAPAEIQFGALKSLSLSAAKTQAETWLKTTPSPDMAVFDRVWSAKDLTVLDRLSETFKLGNADAKKMLNEALTADAQAPKEVPALLKDAKQDAFFRSNLALAYAANLSSARVYEESLEALASIKAEQVADPGAYYFYRAVAEHALIKKTEAGKSIVRLLDDVSDAPDRYKMLATIMFLDMQAWKADPKDLNNIVKLMDNSERRLDLSRPGKITQDIQKKIVFRLDEAIKEKEEKAKGGGQANGGQCPNGGKPMPGNGGGATPSAPMQDSNIATNGGPGQVMEQKLRHYQDNWGKMPEADRAKAITEITRDLPPRYKLVVEDYFKSLNKAAPSASQP